MNLFRWFKPKDATLKEPEWWKQARFIRPTSSGQSVTIDNALRVSTVYACVRILSESISSLPLKVYQKTDNGRQEADHPLNQVFMLPNSIQTGFEMREFLASCLVMQGNAYAQKLMSNRGEVGEIIPLYPQDMNIDKDSRGRLVFDYQEAGAARQFTQAEIWRIAGLGSNGVTGLSPIGLARESIGLAMALEEHGATLFKNGAQVGCDFEIPGQLSDDAYERLKKDIAAHQGSANAHQPMILESGLTRKNIGMTSEDSQFIETRKLQVADIARFYRVPLHMLNELDKATFSNIEHQSIEFVRDSLTPWLVRIESAIYRDLLSKEERKQYFVKHSVNALLRGDIKSRFEAYGMAIRDSWMKPNEARRFEDMNTEDGLDDFILPENMSTITERQERMENAVIDDLVSKEIKALKKDRGNDNLHFIDFYSRHLQTSARLLSVDQSNLIPYGEARMEAISKGITDEFLSQIAQSGATELKALCQS